jgi:phage shock protein PspC (stress-responsive transcriptional regulator)
MQKVVNISLNGIAYQLEEPGFLQLRAYLERAESRLKDSPDRAEVMADLEQAIGEKCRAVLGPHKTVVSTAEVERIIEEMGPVQAAEDRPEDAPGAEGVAASPAYIGPRPRKRLFKIREGEMFTGVCNGIAAYINVDPTWVRIGVTLLTVFSWGGLFFVYLALAFIIPYAETPEDRAAAFGMPFNTEELISRAKKNFEEFGERYRWRREWRRQQRHWNRQFRHMNEQLRVATAHATPVVTGSARVAGALFTVVAALVSALVFVVLFVAMFSLVTQHAIFGWDLPHGVPLWVAVVALLMAYVIISTPLRMIRQGGQQSLGYHPGWAALHGLMWVGFIALLFWVAYLFVPGVREVLDQLMWAADLTATTLSETIV